MNQTLHTLIDSFDQGAALCDIESLTFIEANETMKQWFKLDDKTPSSLESHLDSNQLRRLRRATDKGRKLRFQKVFTMGARDETVELNSKPIELSDGNTVLLLQGIKDNSAQQAKKLEAMQNSYNELLLEKDRAEAASKAKSEFMATMSHELRTPMNSILGMAQQLGKTQLGDSQIRYLETIQGSGTQLLAIINEILDYSKMEAGKLSLTPEPIDIIQLVQEVFNLCSFDPNRKEGVELKQTVPNEPYPTVLGDRTRIKQILINIVGNAIKFTEKGSIELCLNGTPDETNRTYQFEISVKDTGIGIPEEKISTLFDPFTQAESSTTRRFGGTGLGLTITKQLLDLMNGTLSTTSQVGVGSTFTVHLELMAVTSEQGLNAPAGPSNISNGEQHPWESISLDGMTLMVVDDTPMNCDLVGLALDEQEITLLVANNGEEAVNLFKQQHIDLIFMDCLMPVMDGFEASKAIREHEAHTSHNTSQNSAKNKTPIIALTASASKEINERCKQSGMDDVMLKPFDFNELIKKVQFWRYQAR